MPRAALALLVLLLAPLAAAQPLPFHVEADVTTEGARVEVDARRDPGAFGLPGAASNLTPRLSAELAWRARWEPFSCDAPEVGAYAWLHPHELALDAPAAPSRCAFAIGEPAPPPHAELEWLELPELPRAPPLLAPLAQARAELQPARTAEWATAGVAHVDLAPLEGHARAAGELLLSTPLAHARVEAEALPEADAAPLARDAAAPALARGVAPAAAPDGRAPAAEPARALPRDERAAPARADAPAPPAPAREAEPELRASARAVEARPPAPGAPIALAVAAALVAAALALYQRIRRPAALDHPGRRALHEACVALGRAATAGELAARVGQERKTAEYHLLYLARLGLVRVDEAPDAPRRFAAPTAPAAPREAPLDERLLAALAGREAGLTARELCEAVGVTRTRAERRLRALALAGRVEARRGDGARRYHRAA
ncbi:MAG TPA: helix-turn-helix domain-containing protein [Candidatus Thermoplasmatota archaeon]|nr:helix-turn-helix domain-containing protein [Candidatus Thermoplasmatota archaeon]